MKRRILAASAALAALVAGQAFAGDAITAKLATPVAEKTKVIAGGAMFSCEGDTCVALAPMSNTFAAATCRVIADKVGAVAAFSGRRALDDRGLADCNQKALAKAAGARNTLAKQ
jgi:hypothetical protein